MGFRIGRSRAQHTYPQSRSGTPYARNFASAFKDDFTLTDTETPIPWSVIDGGAPAWDAAVTYQTGAIVSQAGTTWISTIADNIGNEPGVDAGWDQNTIVPITPVSTGIVVIHAVITVGDTAAAPHNFSGFVAVNGVPLPIPLSIEGSVDTGEETTISVLAEVTGLPLGVRADIEVALATDQSGFADVLQDSTTIEVREMQAATG